MTDEIQHKSAEAREFMQQQRERLRVYTPALGNRLLLTYLVPIIGMLAVTTLLGVFGSRALPESTLSLLGLAANIVILVYGWRWAEKRLRGTSLFVLWSRYNKERRELELLLKRADASHEMQPEIIDMKRDLLQNAADNVVSAMQGVGVSPQAS